MANEVAKEAQKVEDVRVDPNSKEKKEPVEKVSQDEHSVLVLRDRLPGMFKDASEKMVLQQQLVQGFKNQMQMADMIAKKFNLAEGDSISKDGYIIRAKPKKK